jgi:hypothetical protein
VITGLVTVLVVVGGSWVVLRGAAMASRRIRLNTRAPLEDLWQTIGYCGTPPHDQSRKFATIAIALTVGAWVVLPAASRSPSRADGDSSGLAVDYAPASRGVTARSPPAQART